MLYLMLCCVYYVCMYTVHMYVRCTLYNVHYTDYNNKCTMYIIPIIIINVQCTLYRL